MREPFFRKQTQCWYVKDMAGRFIRLDPDKDTAFELWHKLQSAQIFEGDNATVGGLIDAFLAEIDGSVSPARLDVLVYYTSLFSNSHGSDLVSSVRPSLVSRWLKAPKPGRIRLNKDGEMIKGPASPWLFTFRHVYRL